MNFETKERLAMKSLLWLLGFFGVVVSIIKIFNRNRSKVEVFEDEIEFEQYAQ